MGGAANRSRRSPRLPEGFNRRGDSLGGAAPGIRCKRRGKAVSIAGAILWGVLRGGRGRGLACIRFQSQGRFFGGCCKWDNGENIRGGLFQSQGRFFGGCCCNILISSNDNSMCFNRRGDSLGGAAQAEAIFLPIRKVSIAGAILWGVLLVEQVGSQRQGCCFNRRGDSLGGAAQWGSHPQKDRGSFNRRGDSLGGAASRTK